MKHYALLDIISALDGLYDLKAYIENCTDSDKYILSKIEDIEFDLECAKDRIRDMLSSEQLR